MKKIFKTAALFITISITGCATVMDKSDKEPVTFTVTSNVPAFVFYGKNQYNIPTPAKLTLERNANLFIIKADGYQTEQVLIPSEFNTDKRYNLLLPMGLGAVADTVDVITGNDVIVSASSIHINLKHVSDIETAKE